MSIKQLRKKKSKGENKHDFNTTKQHNGKTCNIATGL